MEKMISDTRYHINKYLLAFILSFTILCFFLVLNHEIYLPIGSNISDFTGDGIKIFSLLLITSDTTMTCIFRGYFIPTESISFTWMPSRYGYG
ncbi:MAG: hypothetical protein IPM95_15545 [Sphingobacteriales bacterium]|nr:hypothetical protein [Sphingobacteriales bacterium]